MKKYIRRALKYTAIVAAVPLILAVILVGPIVVSDLIAQGRVDRVFYNELCRGVFSLTQNAIIRGTAASYGLIGNSTYPIRAVTSDSVVADKVVADTIEVGTTVGGSNGSTLQWVVNHTGAGVGRGRFMVARSTSIKVVNAVGTTGFSANRTIADSLNSWIPSTRGAKMMLAVRAVGTTATTDSVYVRGLDENGASQNKKLPLLSGVSKTTQFIVGTGKAATKVYWTKVDSVSFSLVATAPTGADSVALEAYPMGAVEAATSASTGDFVGVTVDTMANKALGRVCIYGPVDGRVNAGTTALTPGAMIELAGWGVGVTDAAATTAKNVAWALEYAGQDSLLTRVFVDKY